MTPMGVVRVESEPPGASPTYQVGVYWWGGGWLSAPHLVSVWPVSLPLQVVGLGLRILDVLCLPDRSMLLQVSWLVRRRRVRTG